MKDNYVADAEHMSAESQATTTLQESQQNKLRLFKYLEIQLAYLSDAGKAPKKPWLIMPFGWW